MWSATLTRRGSARPPAPPPPTARRRLSQRVLLDVAYDDFSSSPLLPAQRERLHVRRLPAPVDIVRFYPRTLSTKMAFLYLSKKAIRSAPTDGR